MADKSSLTTNISIRFPNEELALIDAKAKMEGVSRSEMLVRLVRLGLADEAATSRPLTQADLASLDAKIEALTAMTVAFEEVQKAAIVSLLAEIKEGKAVPALPVEQPEQDRKGFLGRLFNR